MSWRMSTQFTHSNVLIASSYSLRAQRMNGRFLAEPTDAGKSGSTLAGEFWGGHLDGVSGTLGFPLARRVSLMPISMLVVAMGVSRGGWADEPEVHLKNHRKRRAWSP